MRMILLKLQQNILLTLVSLMNKGIGWLLIQKVMDVFIRIG